MLLFTILCGLAGAGLRAFQLTRSFHPDTALIERCDPWTCGLLFLSVLFTAAAALYALSLKGKTLPGKRLGIFWRAAAFTAIAALFAASGYDLFTGIFDSRLGIAALGFLGMFAAAALLMVSLNINKLPFTSAAGFWATLPVFWACLMLVADFWSQMGNPVRNTYVYGMLAAVCCTLALYTIAGFFFEKVKPGRALFFALPGIYFAILSAGGALAAPYLGEPAVTLSLPAMLRLVFIALYLTAASAAVLRGRFTPPEERDKPDEDAAVFDQQTEQEDA